MDRSRTVGGKSLREALVGLQSEVLDILVTVDFGRRVYRDVCRKDVRTFHVVDVLTAMDKLWNA